MKDNVKVNINGKVFSVIKGTLLSDILDIEKPCGGHGICGKCNVIVNGKNELACKYLINSDVEIVYSQKKDIVSNSGVKEDGHLSDNLCLALDIGTTTIALALVSLDSKKVIKVITKTNPQRIYGADVMSRIEYCQKNSINNLQSVLVDKVNEMINEFSIELIDTMYVSANVTILHTFFGVDCASIGVAPYKAQFLEKKVIKAKDIGINKVQTIISLPSIASFVGADIVAGMNYIGMPTDDDYYLLVDLGTNAEIVLFSNKKGICTSAAAGPCFEGANICCGMSATDGAIYAFDIVNAEKHYYTINDCDAVGICGTGLIDIISKLLKNGYIDDTGYMENDFYLSSNVYISPKDVRQYQLAKSAVYSSIITLLKNENINFNKIQKMFVSGGFSAMINFFNAVESGLFPVELSNKIVSINNSSLLGTIKYALEGGNLEHLIDKTNYIDLTQDEYFNNLFIENMIFNYID